MTRAESDRLRDIAEAISDIAAHLHRAGGIARARATAEPGLADALLFKFVVIGEATKHLAAETREATPEVPWQSIAGLRDMIAHEYFHIELDRVLDVVEKDLPALKAAIDRLLD